MALETMVVLCSLFTRSRRRRRAEVVLRTMVFAGVAVCSWYLVVARGLLRIIAKY
jgi:hypothetical protein